MGLKLYNKKRDFKKTKEPKGTAKETHKRRFVIQEHHATRLHWDFRLEMEGVMKSWAVPKGPSLDPEDKRLAMMVEDHPIDYMYFEGAIPLGQYGGGEVRRWDIGTYEPTGTTPIEEQLRKGKMTFIMRGKKLKGEFVLVHMHAKEQNAWLLRKADDEFAKHGWTMKQILHYGSRSDKPGAEKPSKARNKISLVGYALKRGANKVRSATTKREPIEEEKATSARRTTVKRKKGATAKRATAKAKVAPKARAAKPRVAATRTKKAAVKPKKTASAKRSTTKRATTKAAARKRTVAKRTTTRAVRAKK